MLEKIRNFIDNPYYAPLTQPFKNVAAITMMPINDFIENFREGFDDNDYRYHDDRERPKLLRAFEKLWDSSGHTNFMVVAGHLLGAVAGGVAGGIGTYAVVSGAGLAAKIAATAFGVVATASLGAVAGPFVMMGVAASAAFAVGTALGFVPGIFKGIGKALEHDKLVKAGQYVAAQLPPEKSQDEQLIEKLAPLMAEFNALKPEEQGPFVKMMNDDYLKWSGGGAEKIQKLVAVLPEPEQVKLAKTIQGILQVAFDKAAAQNEAEAKAATLAPSDPEGDDPIVAPARATFRRPAAAT